MVLRVQKGIPHTHVQDANSSDEVAHDERISESEKKKGFKVELEESRMEECMRDSPSPVGAQC